MPRIILPSKLIDAIETAEDCTREVIATLLYLMLSADGASSLCKA